VGLFSKKPKQEEDFSIPANRQIRIDKPNQEDFWESLSCWDTYCRQRINWRWEQIYTGKETDNGWHKGEAKGWQVGEVIVASIFDVETGIVTEKVLK